MPRTSKESLQHALSRMMQEQLGKTLNHDVTRKAYKGDLTRFVAYCKENGLNRLDKIEKAGVSNVIQAYEKNLEARHLSPTTIHRYISPVCSAFRINMSEINHPRRTVGAITRGRRAPGEVKQGDKEAMQSKYMRLVGLQSVTGIRRDELKHLTGKDLTRDQDGFLCVVVRRGKGGKYQEQRILPENEKIVLNTFQGIAPDERVFSKEEMENHINLHGLRAANAKKAYDYYLNRIQKDPGYRKKLQSEIQQRWNMSQTARKDLIGICRECKGLYELRGENRRVALSKGLPTTYDRTALLAVSVFHLSHWRLGVAATNYLTA